MGCPPAILIFSAVVDSRGTRVDQGQLVTCGKFVSTISLGGHHEEVGLGLAELRLTAIEYENCWSWTPVGCGRGPLYSTRFFYTSVLNLAH